MCPAMVVLPPGRFRMGDFSGRGASDERPAHEVTIAPGLAVGKFEITFGEWRACVASGGCGGYLPDDRGWGGDRHPVISISWNDALAYTHWLGRKTGKPYRLLSEAEWEYAARAGSEAPFSWGSGVSRARANYGRDNCCRGHA